MVLCAASQRTTYQPAVARVNVTICTCRCVRVSTPWGPCLSPGPLHFCSFGRVLPCELIVTHYRLLLYLRVPTAGGGGIVALDAPIVDFATGAMAASFAAGSAPVNVSGGNAACGSTGGAGLLILPALNVLACLSSVQTTFGLTTTAVDLVWQTCHLLFFVAV